MSADSPVVKLVKARIMHLEELIVGYVSWQGELNESQAQIDREKAALAAELTELKAFMESENA